VFVVPRVGYLIKEKSYVLNEISVLVCLIPVMFIKSGNFLMSMKQSVSLAYLITTHTQEIHVFQPHYTRVLRSVYNTSIVVLIVADTTMFSKECC
jgi:hypothetical protein